MTEKGQEESGFKSQAGRTLFARRSDLPRDLSMHDTERHRRGERKLQVLQNSTNTQSASK